MIYRALKPMFDFKLDTPEAIMKWIEERKKRYPTDANIAKKVKYIFLHFNC